ncbi:alanine racemase [Brachybacterium sp. EF45031]|uniref:alanine racemase n=1 Tax=Brachybacterium sillae TaxID=2810536 RepID=UPI00217E66BB|nr:alanine racemase [Brachybacterium sillae]MCS6711189.1 alanine racemase [Brachybacterium sillae]
MSVAIPAEDLRQGPNRAVIDRGAITHNARVLGGLLHEQTALMAVVKADGYGHGMLTAAQAALDGGATWLGAAHPASALALVRAGLDVPILTWLYDPTAVGELMVDVVGAGIDVSVGSPEALRVVADAARTAERRARIHLKVDTGMGRGGALPAAARALAAAARDDDHVNLVGIWTHLSTADDPTDPFLDRQVEAFDATVEAVTHEVGPVPLQHLANTAALIARPDLHRDIVRAGIGLYGYPPLPLPDGARLRPALTLTSSIAQVKEVPAGTPVGYGHTATTTVPTRLGLVPIGYADGLHRAASGRGRLVVRTRTGDDLVPQIGRISMDQIVVDLGPESTARVGDRVIVFGEAADAVLGDGQRVPTAADWAEAAGTIPYEVLTSVSVRVGRELRGEGA